MNRRVKSLIERSLVASGAASLASARQPRDAVLVLAYHNVVPAGVRPSGDRSLHLPHDDFARQLDVLQRSHDVVPLQALVDERSARRRRVAITFDDAYAGAMDVGVGELARRGLPATVFVAPGLLGQIPWWDAIARASRTGLTDQVREHALCALAGRQDRVLAWANAGGLLDSGSARASSVSPSERIATLEQLTAAAAYAGLTLAPHTWAHPNLSALPPAELAGELARPLEWLVTRFERTLPLLGYPYGLFSLAVAAAAAGAGYCGAFRVDGGWTSAATLSSDLFAMPRFNVPAGLSADGFQLRLAGLGSGS